MTLTESIKQKAHQLGFDIVGITDASPINDRQVEMLTDWLDCGYASRMSYMQRNLEKRINPARLLKNARSVICVGLNYTPPKDSQSSPGNTPHPAASYQPGRCPDKRFSAGEPDCP